MNSIEIFKVAVTAIWSHKLRSFLTLLGMIIGITAFMVIFSLVQGLSSYIDEKVAKIGSNAFTVKQYGLDDYKDRGRATAQRRNKELSLDELEFIRERALLVDKIGAKAGGAAADIKNESNSIDSVSISGAEPVIADIDNLDIAEGRYFTDVENSNAVRVAFIGADVAAKLFPGGSALGQDIKLHGYAYRVIGIQTAQGMVFGLPMDSFVQLPLKTFSADFGGLRSIRAPSFEATAKSEEHFDEAVEEVKTLLRVKRHLPSGERDNFGIFTPDAMAAMKNRLLGPTFAVVLAVPGIALIVGAIVIMNIMLVSVTERTKEIGIRKALGARNYDIVRQFLCEAVALSAIGGLIGLALAEVLGYLITIYIFQTRIPLWSAVLAIGFSGIVGIAAGLLPAWQAAQLDPIEALRAE